MNSQQLHVDPSNPTISTMLRYSHVGGPIAIRSTLTDDERLGTVIEFLSDAVIIQFADGITHIRSVDIISWRIPSSSSTAPMLPDITRSNSASVTANTDRQEPTTSLIDTSLQTSAVYTNIQSVSQLEALFEAAPTTVSPTPSFDIPHLKRNLQQQLTKWRNRYEYALKVREPARVIQDIAQIVEMAELFADSSLYVLAGSLAHFSGLGPERTRRYYEEASKLGSRLAILATVSILASEHAWKKAADSLLSVLLADNSRHDDVELVRLLGQCACRTEERQLRGLGDFLEVVEAGPTRDLAIQLAALLVKNDTVAAQAALSGNMPLLKTTELGSRLFGHDKQTLLPPPKPHVSPTAQKGLRQGKVSAFRTDMNFGFIIDETTGSTWYFNASHIHGDPMLLRSLQQGHVQQYVVFEGSPSVLTGRYPAATLVKSSSLSDVSVQTKPIRAPLSLRLAAVPKDASLYAKAKHYEQLDQLDDADRYFRDEIRMTGTHIKSAIKDLSSLLNRRGRPEEAIDLLSQHRSRFAPDELMSIEQLTINFLLKARQFDEAATRVSRLAKQETRPMQKRALERQEAYCLFAADKLDLALQKLDRLIRSNPNDSATLLLAEKVRQAKVSGDSETDAARIGDDEGEETLASLAMVLSHLARRQLDTCDLRGLDARTKERREFTKRDFQQLERMLGDIEGRRPRERADYLLTLAALCELSPEAAGSRSLHQLLRRHFSALEEAYLFERAPADVVRCMAIESLALHPVRIISERDSHQIEAAWVLLLGTYLDIDREPSTLLRPDPGKRLAAILREFVGRPSDWDRFVNDVCYYRVRAATAFAQLEPAIALTKGLSYLSTDVSLERARIREDEHAFATLTLESISAERLRNARDALSQRVSHARFDLDRTRLNELVKLVSDAAEYSLEKHFRERETRYLRLETESARLIELIERLPTHLSIENIVPAVRKLRELLKADFQRAETTKPLLDIRNVLDSDFYSVTDGAVALRLLLTSRDESSAPVEAIDLMATGADPCHSPEPLHGGQRRELELYVHPTEAQILDGTFTVTVTVQFRTRTGLVEQLPPQSLAVRLGGPDFTEIPNEYSRYSGGAYIDDARMFFGRTELVARIRSHVHDGTLGQCFVIYGQKRSGKSSVVKRIEQSISSDVVFASLSAGIWSHTDLWGSFARQLIQELAYIVQDRQITIEFTWPTESLIRDRPIEVVLSLLRNLWRLGHRIVVSVDEFTYLFEAPTSETQKFMRGWKAILEAKVFNAILIGLDTMPRFKQAFPNEFGVTHDARISYLSEGETIRMATDPILLDGTSRYRGQALSKLFALTAGSPYFLQIACDRLVCHLNQRRASFITEADIERVAEDMCYGVDALGPEKFDSLVTAAGESVATIPKDILWHVVSRIARESLHSGWCYRAVLSELPRSIEAIKDLVDREILVTEGDRVKIRVEVFAKWLRANY